MLEIVDGPRPFELWHVTIQDDVTKDESRTSLLYNGNGGFGPVNLYDRGNRRWHSVKYRQTCDGDACTWEGCTREPTWGEPKVA